MLGLRHFRGTAIDLFQGEIASFVCDAMVRPSLWTLEETANTDDAIYQAGGPDVRKACQSLRGSPPGTAFISVAGHLPASKLIHAFAPFWQDGAHNESALLYETLRQSLNRAAELNLRHIALPSLGTGFPPKEAARMAMLVVKEFCEQQKGNLRRISFILSDAESYRVYQLSLYDCFPEAEGNSL
ncbi:MAG: macro domain-containing protein [Proteobacteria bacterium]|nr:macro domain-containing protein [Pseudomonadota bacterium]